MYKQKEPEGKQDIIEAIFFHKLSFTRTGHHAGSEFFLHRRIAGGEDSEYLYYIRKAREKGGNQGNVRNL